MGKNREHKSDYFITHAYWNMENVDFISGLSIDRIELANIC